MTMTRTAASTTLILTGILALGAPVALHAQTPAGPTRGTVKLPENEPVRLILMERVSSDRARKGDLVHLEVHQDVTIAGGAILIRKGTPASGEVVSLRDGGLLGKRGELRLEMKFTTAVDGRRIRLKGTVEEGKRTRSTGKKLFNAAKSLVSVGARVFTGGLVGDGSIKGKDAELEPGTQVEARVAQEQVVSLVTEPTVLSMPAIPTSPSPVDLALAVSPVVQPTSAPAASRPWKNIQLQNGDRLLGRIVSLLDGVYTIETRYGTLRIAEADVVEIRATTPAAAPLRATVVKR
jgi:hypothetical protein